MKSSYTCAPSLCSKGIAKIFFQTSFVEGLLNKVKWWVIYYPVFDRNGVISLGIGIGNFKSFIAGKAYLSLELLAHVLPGYHSPYSFVSRTVILSSTRAEQRRRINMSISYDKVFVLVLCIIHLHNII
jgi:hypothetical protein